MSPQKVANPATARAFARPYHHVARRLAEWQAEGYVQLDSEPALYLHEYSVHGMTIRGLVGGMDLSSRAATTEERVVFPHEAVHPEQADELADRMHEMGLNPAPILLVHRGPADVRALQAEIMRQVPDHEFTDRADQHHRLWRITTPAHLDTIEAGLATSTFMIADGHHRYAAYLRLQESHPGTAWDRGLTMVVDQDDTPFFLGAIHRTFVGTSLDALAAAAQAAGATAQFPRAEAALQALGGTTWIATDGDRWMSVDTSELPGHSSPVEDLHHTLVPLLEREPAVQHHHSVEDAIKAAGLNSVSILLPAPDHGLPDRIMGAIRLLPEKATSFQPKPSLGVLMRSVDSELMTPLAPDVVL
ncbi:DUF1015 family protein [Nocardioides gilvus]|uniref:DUF1015 family protein n=1 Tax=Nocardioides gilvus TaxID=1735589 RepID=UPI0013A58E19|nr:DUF1015 family protein [Nocardioides gilvus]